MQALRDADIVLALVEADGRRENLTIRKIDANTESFPGAMCEWPRNDDALQTENDLALPTGFIMTPQKKKKKKRWRKAKFKAKKILLRYQQNNRRMGHRLS